MSVQAGSMSSTAATAAGTSSSTTTSGVSNSPRFVTRSDHARDSPAIVTSLLASLTMTRSVMRWLPKSLPAKV